MVFQCNKNRDNGVSAEEELGKWCFSGTRIGIMVFQWNKNWENGVSVEQEWGNGVLVEQESGK